MATPVTVCGHSAVTELMSPPSEATALAPFSGAPLGEALAGRFQVLRFLGAGPVGTAMSARRLEDGADVDLRFARQGAQSDQLLERWARYQLLDHPHVIALQHVEPAGEDWCAVLDSAPEETLHSALPVDWSLESRLLLLEQIAGALASAHDLGLWHGELTPTCVYLDSRKHARLEFTGVSLWTPALPSHSVPLGWQTTDAQHDVKQLGVIAELLLGGKQAATSHLPWLDELQHEDPLRRPPANDVVRRLRLVQREQPDIGDTLCAAVSSSNAHTPPASDQARQRVGRFELEHLLGEGGMGSVYSAVDVASGQRVALKLLRSDLVANEAVRYRFRKEARVLKAVRSPYIANLIEADITDSCAYMALEFIDGEDLATAFDNLSEPLTESVALQLVADMCRALVEPHRRGIVHRDIKPQNVLLVGKLTQPQQLVVKVCDFGIASARLTPETIGMTQNTLLGTPQYMSPEQCTSAPITPATDVYALGLTLYELLAGRPAFTASDVLQLLRLQMTEQPTKLSEVAPVSDAVVALVERALEKDPSARFADAAEMLTAIETLRAPPSSALSVVDSSPSHARPFQRVAFHVDLLSNAEALWPYVSDTDRMNEAVGLPPVDIERARSATSAATYLSNRVLGMNLRWLEQPFEWVEGRRWSVMRVFESGLMRWYRVSVELQPLPTAGTRLCYTMEFEPRFAFLAWLIQLEVGVKQRSRLTRSFQRVDALLASGHIRTSPSPHAAPASPNPKTLQLVAAKIESLRHAGVGAAMLAALQKHVLFGSNADIVRLRPLRFARAHQFEEKAFTEACLLAAHQGLFTIFWDIVCPLCQIPASFAESLQQLDSHAACPACDVTYPLKFGDSVQLVFRVAPDIRSNELQTYCIGGPAQSPHVAAQLRLAPGERRVMNLQLAEGRHRVRSPQLPGLIELDVQSEHAFSRADLLVGERLTAVANDAEPGSDQRLLLRATEPCVQLASGRQVIAVRNELEHEVTLRVERTADRSDALTAARAWAMPKFRELFPGETLESGRLAAVGELSFLVLRVVDHLDLIAAQGDASALKATLRVLDHFQEAVERHHGNVTSVSMDVAVATFERGDDAVAAALRLWPRLVSASPKGALALHRGSAVATTINQRLAYYGQTVARALQLGDHARGGELWLSSASLHDDVTRLAELTSAPPVVMPAPMLGAAAWCARLRAPDTETPAPLLNSA